MSQVSPRVFVRFVTQGNYSMPGSYQVRVLSEPEASLTAVGPGGSAAVPIANVINNPGSDGVQPLTQAPSNGGSLPSGGAPPGGGPGSNSGTTGGGPSGSTSGGPSGGGPGDQPTPSPTPHPTITSQTVAQVPTQRDRLTIGVGEQVRLTFSGNNAHWTIAGVGGIVSANGKTSLYEASINPGEETISAVDTSNGDSASLPFEVITPTGVHFEVITPGAIQHHHQGRPDCGFSAQIYLKPDTVSFEYIGFREEDAAYTANGAYAWMNGKSHSPSNNPSLGLEVVPGKGTRLSDPDDVWSGNWEFWHPPYAPGSERLDIPCQYCSSASPTGPFFELFHIVQTCTFDGNTLTAEKSDGSSVTTINSTDHE